MARAPEMPPIIGIIRNEFESIPVADGMMKLTSVGFTSRIFPLTIALTRLPFGLKVPSSFMEN